VNAAAVRAGVRGSGKPIQAIGMTSESASHISRGCSRDGDTIWVATAVVRVAVATRSALGAGVSMAGFGGRTDRVVDLRVVPYPAVTVFIDLGDALLIDDACGTRRHGAVVVGLASGGVRISSRARDANCLQMRLSPEVAYPILGGGTEVGGAVIALEDVWGRDTQRVQEQLRGAQSWDERFGIAAVELGRRRERGLAVNSEVAFIWRQMVAKRGQISVERLAAEVGWSRKRVWSRFRSQIGLTPKRAAQLIRFDHAAHLLADGHSAARVAADSGFVDHSHLCRDAMAIAGVTPTAVAEAPWLAVDHVAWPARGSTSATELSSRS